jgi:hypothetical protein
MAGNAGKGREPGSRNRRTQALLELAEAGETPCAFALRLMRDDTTPPDLKMQAAKLAAPYVHPRPQAEPRLVNFEVPEDLTTTDTLLAVHTSVVQATAAGDLGLEDAKDISAMLETHRRLVETVDLEQRIARLEERQTGKA